MLRGEASLRERRTDSGRGTGGAQADLSLRRPCVNARDRPDLRAKRATPDDSSPFPRRAGRSADFAHRGVTVSGPRDSAPTWTRSPCGARAEPGDAAVTAVNTARKSLRDLRVAEVVEQDLHIEDGGDLIFRTKLRLSFKYEDPA